MSYGYKSIAIQFMDLLRRMVRYLLFLPIGGGIEEGVKANKSPSERIPIYHCVPFLKHNNILSQHSNFSLNNSVPIQIFFGTKEKCFVTYPRGSTLQSYVRFFLTGKKLLPSNPYIISVRQPFRAAFWISCGYWFKNSRQWVDLLSRSNMMSGMYSLNAYMYLI